MSEIPENADYQKAFETVNKNILEVIKIIKQENLEERKRKKINEIEEHNIKLEEPGYKIERIQEEYIYSRILPGLKIGKQIQVHYTRIVTQEDIKSEKTEE